MRETHPSRRLALAVAAHRCRTPPKRLLDLGCGAGELLRLAAEHFPGAHLVGADPVAAAIEAARRTLSPIRPPVRLLETSAGDVLKAAPDLEDGCDLVMVHLTFGLWNDPEAGLEAAVRALAPGGLCYLVDILRPDGDEPPAAFLSSARTTAERDYLSDQLGVSWTLGELRECAQAAVRASGKPVTVRAARGGLAGYPLGSAEANALWLESGDVRAALAEFGPADAAATAKMEQTAHLMLHYE